MQFFHVKNYEGSKRRSELILREKSHFMGRAKERYIKKNECLAIYGTNGAGKSHKITQLASAARSVWPKEKIILIRATDTLSEILNKHLKDACAIRPDLEDEETAIDAGGAQYERIAALIEMSKGATVLLDDLHRFAGKKLEIAKDLIRHCRRYVYTAESEIAVNRTIRQIIKRRGFNEVVIDLKSQSAKDASNVLFAVFVIFLFVSGMHEAALLVMAGRYMMRGNK